jgi:hypothetical protein
MARLLSLILLLACLSLIVWFLPSTRNLNIALHNNVVSQSMPYTDLKSDLRTARAVADIAFSF